jgi:RimJ/RimL family protein N-acetyltransferase
MTVAVQRLDDSARAALLTHFLALPEDDQRLRFGAPLSPSGIARYVEDIDFDSSAMFGVHDDRLQLIGVAHLAFGIDMAELGLSVLPAHRGQGIGESMFARAVDHARNRLAPKLFMHCLAENGPIMHMARKFGMEIVLDTGDADAHLELPPASAASIAGEFETNRFALFDHARKVQNASRLRKNDALLA